VEDEILLLKGLESCLQPLSDKIFTANNGQEALEILNENPYIVTILSDIHMPLMNGLELLENIRKLFNPIPFVILTAFGDGQTFQEAVRFDATDFLSKPIDDVKLQEVMSKAIEFGVQLKIIDVEIEKMIESNFISPEQRETFRRAKRTVFSMRIGSSLYLKKPKVG
jgi:YesN/AraC family two-component response regulator